MNKTSDPWFSATTLVNKTAMGVDNSTASISGRDLFRSDEPVGVMGCATYTTHCHPDLPLDKGCVSAYSSNMEDDLVRIWPRTSDQSTLRAYFSAMFPYGAGGIGAFFVLPSLPTMIARRTVLGNVQTSHLAKNHWQNEFESVFQASLAGLQAKVVDFARGYWSGGSFCLKDEPCERLCHSQVCVLSKRKTYINGEYRKYDLPRITISVSPAS